MVIAEDDLHACHALASLLTAEGHQVTEAFDGQQALQLVSELQPHVVVTDLLMPKLDGLSLIKGARETGSRACFVLVTGSAPDEAWEIADHVLPKPLPLERLFQLLERLAPRVTHE